MQANPAKSFKINGFLITPKYYTVFDSLLKSDADTLVFESMSTYSDFPFGMIKIKSKINSGLLKDFNIQEKIIPTDIGKLDFKILTRDSSKLVLSFNRTTPGEYYDIDKAEIYNSNVSLINGVRVGISINDFYKAFFDRFPDQLKNKYKCFEIKTVDAVTHIYTFESYKLKSIKFTSIPYFDIDY